MVTLDTSKNLGGIGALLLFIGVFPYLNYFGILDIVGLILILVALHGIGSYYKESGIFNNALYGVITGIVGIVIAGAVLIAVVLTNITSFLQQLYPSWDGSWSSLSSLSGMTPNTSNINFSDIVPFIVGAIAVLAILWIFAIITMFFERRSLKMVSSKTSVGWFSTAGLLLLIGAVLTIVLIGLLLIWIGFLVLAIAFFTMKPQPQQPPMGTATTPPPA